MKISLSDLWRESYTWMWIIFRDPVTPFMHTDKYVIAIVSDEDILAYQALLHSTVGGRVIELNVDAWFLQPMLLSEDDVEYFARRYKPWTYP